VFPSSFAVIVAGLLVSGLALLAFVWGWWRGQFSHLDRQTAVIFESRDLVIARPWESPQQHADRALRYGDLVAPAGGEWGGAES
jgi:nitrogen fixation-related uncharacterized protein